MKHDICLLMPLSLSSFRGGVYVSPSHSGTFAFDSQTMDTCLLVRYNIVHSDTYLLVRYNIIHSDTCLLVRYNIIHSDTCLLVRYNIVHSDTCVLVRYNIVHKDTYLLVRYNIVHSDTCLLVRYNIVHSDIHRMLLRQQMKGRPWYASFIEFQFITDHMRTLTILLLHYTHCCSLRAH
jgi:DNA-directed RNA polymerase subunit L